MVSRDAVAYMVTQPGLLQHAARTTSSCRPDISYLYCAAGGGWQERDGAVYVWPFVGCGCMPQLIKVIHVTRPAGKVQNAPYPLPHPARVPRAAPRAEAGCPWEPVGPRARDPALNRWRPLSTPNPDMLTAPPPPLDAAELPASPFVGCLRPVWSRSQA